MRGSRCEDVCRGAARKTDRCTDQVDHINSANKATFRLAKLHNCMVRKKAHTAAVALSAAPAAAEAYELVKQVTSTSAAPV